MLRSGAFSLAGRVSVRALRLYNACGLLPPARVDPDSGDRRSSVRQLPRLHRILALKELGLSLDEIARVLDDEPSPAELRALLERKRAEVHLTIVEAHTRLARIEARLHQMDQSDQIDQIDPIQQEDPMPEYDVVVGTVPAQRVAAIRETLPAYPAVGALFQEIGAFLGAHRLRPGAFVAVWHGPEFQERDVDGGAAVVIDGTDPLPTPPASAKARCRRSSGWPARSTTAPWPTSAAPTPTSPPGSNPTANEPPARPARSPIAPAPTPTTPAPSPSSSSPSPTPNPRENNAPSPHVGRARRRPRFAPGSS